EIPELLMERPEREHERGILRVCREGRVEQGKPELRLASFPEDLCGRGDLADGTGRRAELGDRGGRALAARARRQSRLEQHQRRTRTARPVRDERERRWNGLGASSRGEERPGPEHGRVGGDLALAFWNGGEGPERAGGIPVIQLERGDLE